MLWKTEKRKISDLNPAEYNPREMNEKEVADLTASLDSFDLVDPIVVNLNNTIIGGHQRIKILKIKGIESVDVRVPDRQLSHEEEVELNLRLNKNKGRFNFEELANMDEAILKKVGFDEEELKHIFTDSPGAGGSGSAEVQFSEEMKEEYNYVVLTFKNEIDWLQALSVLGLETVKALDSKKNFVKKGIGRVIDGAGAIERIRGSV